MNPSHKKDFDSLAEAYLRIHEAKAPVESQTKVAIDTTIETNKARKEADKTGTKLPPKVQRLDQSAGKTLDNKTKQLQASNTSK